MSKFKVSSVLSLGAVFLSTGLLSTLLSSPAIGQEPSSYYRMQPTIAGSTAQQSFLYASAQTQDSAVRDTCERPPTYNAAPFYGSAQSRTTAPLTARVTAQSYNASPFIYGSPQTQTATPTETPTQSVLHGSAETQINAAETSTEHRFQRWHVWNGVNQIGLKPTRRYGIISNNASGGICARLCWSDSSIWADQETEKIEKPYWNFLQTLGERARFTGDSVIDPFFNRLGANEGSALVVLAIKPAGGLNITPIYINGGPQFADALRSLLLSFQVGPPLLPYCADRARLLLAVSVEPSRPNYTSPYRENDVLSKFPPQVKSAAYPELFNRVVNTWDPYQ